LVMALILLSFRGGHWIRYFHRISASGSCIRALQFAAAAAVVQSLELLRQLAVWL